MIPNRPFMWWERLFFRIYWITVVVSYTIVLTIMNLRDRIEDVADSVGSLLVLLLFVPVVSFFIAIVRVLKFLVQRPELEEGTTIWRSVVTFVLAPFTTGLYFFLLFAVLLSFASCTYNG